MLDFSTEAMLAQTKALESIAAALSIAVDMDFMAREHGAAVWKNYLKNSGFDVPKKNEKKEDVC